MPDRIEDTIPAIQTTYAGIKFRSRIEARWAVVFDNIGIDWEYEREGYSLSSGPYLPDFYLTGVSAGRSGDTWFEVKGKAPTEIEALKAHELAHATGVDVIIASGSIPERHADVWDTAIFSPEWGSGWTDLDYRLSACPTCGRLGFVFTHYAGRICRQHYDELLGIRPADGERINFALSAGRNERFERNRELVGEG
jgi:hypothetical protein